MRVSGPPQRSAVNSRSFKGLRRRRGFRRVLVGCIALGVIALAAAGLVWLMNAMRAYNPQYYEPKDLERERYELQRRATETNEAPVRR